MAVYWNTFKVLFEYRVVLFSLPLNPYSTELFNLNFRSLEAVSRYRDPQLQVTENHMHKFAKFSFLIY